MSEYPNASCAENPSISLELLWNEDLPLLEDLGITREFLVHKDTELTDTD